MFNVEIATKKTQQPIHPTLIFYIPNNSKNAGLDLISSLLWKQETMISIINSAWIAWAKCNKTDTWLELPTGERVLFWVNV